MRGRPAHVKVDRFGLKVECPRHQPPVMAEYARGTRETLTNWYAERQAFYDRHRDCKKAEP